MTGSLIWLGGQRPALTARADADTLRIDRWLFTRAAGAVDGFTDSLAWNAGTALGDASRFDAAGRWYTTGDVQLLGVDSLLAKLAVRRYRLQEPIVMTLSDSAPSVSPATLRALDGSSVLQAAGRVPGKAPAT